MKVFTLRNDRVADVKVQEALKSDYNVWIRSISPDDVEIALLSDITHAPIEEFKEFMKQDERSRLDVGKHFQLILRVPFLEDGSVVTVPVTLFIYKKFIITVEKEKTAMLDYIENLVVQNKRRFLFTRASTAFLVYFIDRVNDEFFAKTDKIADTLELFRSSEKMSKEMMQKVYSLSVTLSFFNQALIANIDALNALRKLPGKFTVKDKEQFKELYFDALQIFDAAKVQREIVLHLFSLQSIITSARMNEYIKRLTILTVIIMIPTMISGIYGMNLSLPFAEHPNGFFIVLGIMLISAVVGVAAFKLMERF